MKKIPSLILFTILGGITAFALRLWQNLRGFEENTGLPIPDAPAGTLLVIFLLLLAAGLTFLVFRLPKAAETPSFPEGFCTGNSRQLFLPVLGVFLMVAAGLVDLAEGLGMGNVLIRLQTAANPSAAFMEEAGGFSPLSQILLGILSLLSAAALFSAMTACRRSAPQGSAQPSSHSFSGVMLLIPPVAMVVRLVLTYRLDSVEPALEAYYVELLALIFLTLGFYRLSSFAFGAGKERLFFLYTCIAIVLCCAVLADGGPYLSSLVLYIGSAVALMGFLLLHLAVTSANCTDT